MKVIGRNSCRLKFPDVNTKEELYLSGLALMEQFCRHNKIPPPAIKRLGKTDRLFHLATCAYYRPYTITIMVEKCATPGMGGRAWSWPSYTVDRTPYGVIQHELGHHVDEHFSVVENGILKRHFSREIYEASGEKPLTGYLGKDDSRLTFYMEWFAEHFRLFVTNPDLSRILSPKFERAIRAAKLTDFNSMSWEQTLRHHNATDRIIDMARKKIATRPALELSL